jgi:hypothetical protein
MGYGLAAQVMIHARIQIMELFSDWEENFGL